MSWSTIAEADVLSEFNSAEQTAIVAQQGAIDNLGAILTRVVNATRSSVLAGGGQQDQPGTVPDQLREEVIAIARWRWIISLPKIDETLQSESRKQAYVDAVARLDKVAEGKIKIEVPSTPIATTAPTNAVAVPRPGVCVDIHGFKHMASS